MNLQRIPRARLGLLLTGALLAGLTLLGGCSLPPAWSSEPLAPASAGSPREVALAQAVPMPDNSQYETRYLDWSDNTRQRTVAAKLYLPTKACTPQCAPAPLLVFSHGLGGSREGYSYIGKYLAANGYASLHVQHVGSDRRIWGGSAFELVERLQAAAADSEALNRVADVRYALDQVLAGPLTTRLDARRIVAAGHSYGANTTLLLAGAAVPTEAQAASATAGAPPTPQAHTELRDPRIRAAIVISAPPFYGRGDLQTILAPVRLPMLHITATGDEILVPGYHSRPQDRIAVFEATGSRHKTLAVFKDGSHSMFTDRLNTGGNDWNPQVKVATRELVLAFLRELDAPASPGNSSANSASAPVRQWNQAHGAMLARLDVVR